MSLFKRSDEEIAAGDARLAADGDLEGLAAELHKGDARRRAAAAVALGRFGAAAVPKIVAATLPRDDEDAARLGAWEAFQSVGEPAAGPVAAGVMSMDTLLAADVPAALRYYQRAIAAIGPGSQDDVAVLVDARAPWREAAEACLRERSTRTSRVNTHPAPSSHILMPISLGEQEIEPEQVEEVLRATTRQWAVTCLLGFAAGAAKLHDATLGFLEAAVVDALDGDARMGAGGLPELAPVDLMRRHESGEKGVLARLQSESLAARTSPDAYPPEERRRREDLLIGTLALGVLRKYSHQGAGAGLAPAAACERFAHMLQPSDGRGGLAAPARAWSLLAGFELCCEMHLREAAAQLAQQPPLAEHTAAIRPAAAEPLDQAVVLQTIRTLRAGRTQS